MTKSVAAPNVTPGAKQLIFVDQPSGNQAESQKSNNLIALPITFTQADVDLTLTAATAPAVVGGRGRNGFVDWSVQNQGGETAAGDWKTRLSLRRANVGRQCGQLIDSFTGPASLAAGESYSPVQTVTLARLGQRQQVFVVRDQPRPHAKAKPTTPTTSLPCRFRCPRPILASTALTGPASAASGPKIPLAGPWPTKAPWRRREVGRFDLPLDSPTGNPFGIGDDMVGSFSHDGPLAAGDSYTHATDHHAAGFGGRQSLSRRRDE